MAVRLIGLLFFTLCNMAGLACSTVDACAEDGGPVECNYSTYLVDANTGELLH